MDEELKRWLGLDEDSPIPADYAVPFFVHEQDMNRLEMGFKRESTWKNVIMIILIAALIGTNAGWFWYENQFVDEVTVEQDAEWENGDVILNGTGEVIYNGESTSNSN